MATEEKFYIHSPEQGARLGTSGSFGWIIEEDNPSTYDQTRYFTTKQNALNQIDTLEAGEYVIKSVFVKTD